MKNFLRSWDEVFIFSPSGKYYLRFENIKTLELCISLIVPELSAQVIFSSENQRNTLETYRSHEIEIFSFH